LIFVNMPVSPRTGTDWLAIILGIARMQLHVDPDQCEIAYVTPTCASISHET
jgi:hypothetical protein